MGQISKKPSTLSKKKVFLKFHPPPWFNSKSSWKIDAWKTRCLSFLGPSANFQGRTVKLPGSTELYGFSLGAVTFSYWCTGVKSDATWFRWCLKGEDWLSCLGLRWENFIRFGFSHLQLGKISAITVIGLISFVSLVSIWNDLYPPRNDHISPKNWHFWVDDVPAFPFGVICDHSLEGRFIQVVFWSVQMTQSVTALTMRTMEPLRFLLNLVPWTSIFLWLLQLDDEPNLY